MSSQLNKKLIRELLHLKVQVFSIAAVVGIGVAVLFGFSSTYESLKKSRDAFYKLANFSDLFIRLKKAPNQAADLLERLEGVQMVETRLEYDALLSLPDFVEPAVGHLISIPDGQQPKMNQIFLKQGRLPQSLATDEIVIGENFFKAHNFVLGDSFFATLNGRQRELHIVGVGVTPENIISIQAGSMLPDDLHFTNIWINESVLAASYDMRASFNSAVAKITAGVPVVALLSKFDDQLNRYGGVGAINRDKQVSYVYVREELKQLKVQALSIPIIFFLVAAFILNVVMSRMVRSQRGDIATLKALGYLDSEISSYYFKIAATIVVLGAFFGLGIGLWIGNTMTKLYAAFYHFPELKYDFSYFQFFIGIIVSLLTALVGVYSSLKGIFRLQPAEAMRPPTPHLFHKGFFENQKWFRLLTTRSRMIIRGVTNFPGKAVMTGLGLCFSIVILVSGLFWQDSMDFLMLAQYSFTQKETGAIQLTHALSPQAVKEVQNIPGVIEAEGYRSSAVKVRYENREEITAIKGLPKKARLLGLVNEQLEELTLPESGVSISRILANQLEVNAGDTLTLEFLEGRKPTVRLKVSNIVDSMMSNEILTSRSTLAKVLKTDDLVDRVLFRSYLDSTILYTKLKAMPNVLSVTYRDSVLKFFEENSAQFILVFAFILSVFASAIGFGVAYNSLRVSLSERDWELATLRILGFTVPEVFRILISEILLLLALFLPVGWILGYLNARWLLTMMSMDNFQIPFLVSPSTYFWATLILLFSTAVSAVVIYRLISKSDMVASLKSRG